MPEEIKKEEQPNASGDGKTLYADMLAEAIKKKNSEIETVKAEKDAEIKRLTDIIASGQSVAQKAAKEEPAKKEPTLSELTEKFRGFDENTTNLEYWDTFIKMRDKCIAEKGYDPCVTHGIGPDGNPLEATQAEKDETERSMKIIKEAIEESDGDANKFNLNISPFVKHWQYGK